MGGGGAPSNESPVIPRYADVWDVLDAIFAHKPLHHQEDRAAQKQQSQQSQQPAPPMGAPPMGGMGGPPGGDPMGGGMPPMDGMGGPHLQG
jgi:hypothetical protein